MYIDFIIGEAIYKRIYCNIATTKVRVPFYLGPPVIILSVEPQPHVSYADP